MFSPVSVSGCAINLIIALVLIYIRVHRGGRDWLLVFALAHAANAITYALIIPYPHGAALTNFLNSPWGLSLSFGRIISAALTIAAALLLCHGLRPWRTTAIVTAIACAGLVAWSFLASPYAAFQAAFAIGALASLSVGIITFRGPTIFYKWLGITWIGRGAMVTILAFVSQVPGGNAWFDTIGILNVVFIAATGFSLILIELDDARRIAADASNAKTQFIANMSHELRTPLNAIIGFSEILEGRAFSPSPEQGRHYAGLVLQAGRHLLGMVDALLDMASIEARHEKLEPQSVRADAMVKECAAMLATEAANRQVRLRIAADGGSLDLVTDPRALRQILLNLMGNAVKFSPPDGEVGIEIEAPDDGPIVIRISDQGPGIAAHHLQRIFDPFFQSDDTYSRAKGGVGLGLAIAHRLAAALGGSIAVDSRLGSGSQFAVILPRSGPRIVPAPAT